MNKSRRRDSNFAGQTFLLSSSISQDRFQVLFQRGMNGLENAVYEKRRNCREASRDAVFVLFLLFFIPRLG